MYLTHLHVYVHIYVYACGFVNVELSYRAVSSVQASRASALHVVALHVWLAIRCSEGNREEEKRRREEK